MYLISLYFSEESKKHLVYYQEEIETITKQSYMKQHHIPLHLTLATCKELDVDQFIKEMNERINDIHSLTLDIVSFGVFHQSTLYALPVYNQPLHNLSVQVNDLLDHLVGKRHNRYLPFHCVPHISLMRKGNLKEIEKAMNLLNQLFVEHQLIVESIALSCSKPYKDLYVWKLRC